MTGPIQFPSAAVFYEAPVLDEEEQDCPFSCFCEEMHDGFDSIKADIAEIKEMSANSLALTVALVDFKPVSDLARELELAVARKAAIAALPWLVRIFA